MPKYTYLRDEDNIHNNKVVTIATEVHYDTNEIFYSVAFCGKKDHFTKDTAHAICTGRLAVAPDIIPLTELSHNVILQNIIDKTVQRPSVPSWAKKLLNKKHDELSYRNTR